MLQCPVYETLRQKYLSRKYYIFPNVNKFYTNAESLRDSHSILWNTPGMGNKLNGQVNEVSDIEKFTVVP